MLRDELFAEWERLGVRGRVYVAAEGINAQCSVGRAAAPTVTALAHAAAALHQRVQRL